jgi:hypothetical protein
VNQVEKGFVGELAAHKTQPLRPPPDRRSGTM